MVNLAMPEATSAISETEIALPRQRAAAEALGAQLMLRPAVASFIGFWFDWVDALGRLPERNDLDPVQLKPWLQSLRIIRVEPGLPQHVGIPGLSHRYCYRLIGTGHRVHDDRDFTNTYLDETNLSLERVAFLGRTYERIIDDKWPIMMNHDHFGSGTGVYACQRLLCPMTDGGDRIAELFGVWSYGKLVADTSKVDDITRADLLRNQNIDSHKDPTKSS